MWTERLSASLLAVFILGGCSAATAGAPGSNAPAPASAALPAPSEADVEFMTGMIHHHGQALVMTEMAATHGANEAVRTLANRIHVSQTDEIGLIELWLRDRNLPVPEPSPTGMRMIMNGVEHDMLMPGMLTQEEMAALDRARGADFDRLFLTYMIRHHEGALVMVENLFASPNGGVENDIYKFASDTFADQGSEIDRMQRLLEAMQGQSTVGQ